MQTKKPLVSRKLALLALLPAAAFGILGASSDALGFMCVRGGLVYLAVLGLAVLLELATGNRL